MNIYVINPKHLKIETFHSLCEILKVSYIYNLIKDDYIDSYISGSECNIDFNIRKLKAINDNSWKKGVYAFLDRISFPIFDNGLLIGRELKEDLIDMEHSNRNAVYNIINSNAINVLVLQDANSQSGDQGDFVDYAQKIILKYTNIGKQIRDAIVGVEIDSMLFPKYFHSYRYTPILTSQGKMHHSEWREYSITSKKTGRDIYPMESHLQRSFKQLLSSQEGFNGRLLDKLLTEDGYNVLKKRIKRYLDDLREEDEYWEKKWRDEEEAADAEWRFQDTMNEFRSMMDDCDAWGNID